MEPEDWIEGSKFVQRHVTLLVPFPSASHDVDIVVEAFEGVFLVEGELFFCLVLDESTVSHLGIAHWWSIEDPIELSSQRYCGPVRLAHGIRQRVVDVLVIHCAGRRKSSNGVEGHGRCLELELYGQPFPSPVHVLTYHVSEHIFP
jgi:hypothetical protein